MSSIGAFKADSKTALIDNLKFFAKDFNDYLIQEYVDGREYVVDAFSLNGAHNISSVSHYKKENYHGAPMYRYTEIESDKEIWDKCANYAIKALTALEVKNGFTHSELMMDANGDLKLIELNNRISGGKGVINKLAKLCNLIAQDEILINFLKTNKIAASDFQKMQGYARCLNVFNFTNDAITKDPREKLAKFESVKEIIMYKKVGEINKISDKINMTDLTCLIVLFNLDYQQLERDSAEIFKLEKAGLLV